MRKTLLFMFCAGFAFACAPSGDKKSTASTTSSKPGVDGAKIYKTYCVTCHGIYGDMGASGAFNLQTSALSLDERIEVITNGRNAMTPFKELLNKEKIEAVAEYIETLRK